MVKALSSQHKQDIEHAVTEAYKQTSAEIVVVVLPASDPYLDFILAYGILFADFLTLGLWSADVYHHFLDLLAIQIAVLAALFFIPFLHRLLWCLVPRRILRQRSAKKAMEEYHHIHRRVTATMPMVVLFVSLAEHYTHILTSHAVYEKISNEKWDNVIRHFAAAVSAGNVTMACVAAVGEVGAVLGEHFPVDEVARHHSHVITE